MTTVTEHYGISGEVPFLNVHVDRDNLIFLDPSAIRNDHSPRGRAAYAQLQSMFTRVVEAARSSDPKDHARGRLLLRHMHEPNETRLGMSQFGANGKGFGDELSDQFWDELRANPACQAAVLERLEDTRVFLAYVGNDRISDMTTRIIFNVLADFTAEMMDTYPALRAGATTAVSDVWTDGSEWKTQSFTLPHCAGKQLLLVPREWVFWRTLMEPVQFYNRFATQVLQDESVTVDDKGKRRAKSKRSIKQDNPLVRPLNNQKAVEYKAEHDRDLCREYRGYIDMSFQPMTADEAARRMS
ncbi:hypothetical protein [Mycobacterium sp. C31M]